jgi:hypothetical protein
MSRVITAGQPSFRGETMVPHLRRSVRLNCTSVKIGDGDLEAPVLYARSGKAADGHGEPDLVLRAPSVSRLCIADKAMTR